MEDFHAENPCPRCGNVGAGYKFHATGCLLIDVDRAHMHRTCGWCAHEWGEVARLALRRRTADQQSRR